MSTAALLLLGVFATSPATAAAEPMGGSGVLVLVDDDGASDGELGFWDEYFPFSVVEDPHPATDDMMVAFWLSHMFLPFGWLWAPYVFGDVRPGSSYVLDALLIVVFHALASACFIPVVLIPILGWILFCPVAIWSLINAWYMTPVALLNAYDRSITTAGAGKATPQDEGGDDDDEGGDDDERGNEERRKRRPPREEAKRPGLGGPAVTMAF